MKKYALILLCLALVVAAGCGKQTAPEPLPETTETPTTLPTETTEPPTGCPNKKTLLGLKETV